MHVLFLITVLAGLQSTPGELKWAATTWSYESLCSFSVPQIKPRTAKVAAKGEVRAEMMSCESMITEFGHPTAVVVTVHNSGNVKTEFRYGPLSAVKLRGATGETVNALSEGFPRGGLGNLKQIVTTSEAQFVVEIPPGEETSLIYLFPRGQIGDTVVMGGKPVSIPECEFAVGSSVRV